MTETVDWSQVGDVGFWCAERAARTVARQYPRVEEDDAFQEAVIYFATHPGEMQTIYDGGAARPGTLGGDLGGRKSVVRQLGQRLREWAEREAMRSVLEIAAFQREEKSTPYVSRWAARATPPGFEGLPYTPALIEHTLGMLWDPASWGGVQVGTAPDPDMPKSKSNPAHSGTHMAHLADLRRAWAVARIPNERRAALFLTAVCRMTVAEAARELGAARKTTEWRADRAIEALAAVLNGEEVSLSGDPDE